MDKPTWAGVIRNDMYKGQGPKAEVMKCGHQISLTTLKGRVEIQSTLVPVVQKTDLASSRQSGRWYQSRSIYSSRLLLFSCQAPLLHPGYKENPHYPTILAGGRWTSTWPSVELLIVDSFLSTTQSVTSQGAHQLELCILQWSNMLNHLPNDSLDFDSANKVFRQWQTILRQCGERHWL